MSRFSEAVKKVREVGASNARIVPTQGRKFKVEILSNGSWVTVLRDLEHPIAEDVIRQATNKVLLG
jgi:hypothetical protein